MRIVFAGTPDAAVPSLRGIIAAGHEIALVITREDAPFGRKRILTPSPVARAAAELGLTILKTNRISTEQTTAIAQLNPDVGVIVAFGALLQKPLLDIPKHGWLNIHFSLLPRWRGAAPVQHALIAGDTSTGITIFRLDEGLDSGDLLAQEACSLNHAQSAGSVLSALADAAPKLLSSALEKVEHGNALFQPQFGKPTFAPKLTRQDAKLDFADIADEVISRWAGVTPEPGAYCLLEGVALKVISARLVRDDAVPHLRPGLAQLINHAALVGTGTRPIELVSVQPAGKGVMSGSDWLRGRGGEVQLT